MSVSTVPRNWQCDFCNRGVAANFLKKLLGPSADLREIAKLACGHFMHNDCIGWQAKETATADPSSPTGFRYDMRCPTCKVSTSTTEVFTVPKPATNIWRMTMTACAVTGVLAAYWMNT